MENAAEFRQVPEGVKPDQSVYSVGAYDRFNYGDLLFPLMLDHAAKAFGASGRINHLAVVDADMTPEGGVPVRSVRSAERQSLEPWQGLILGGGELLSATWSQALINLAPYPLDFALRACRKAFGERVVGHSARMVLRGTWPSPYVPTASLATETLLAVNAVGASSVENLSDRSLARVLATLNAASFVSVRDEVGRSALERNGVRTELAPDSVAILARVWPKVKIDGPRTLVFQCSHQWLWDSADVVPSLLEIARGFDRVVLLPIGLAGGHGDQLALKTIAKRLRENNLDCELPVEGLRVESIAKFIASADLFIGSSLHGAITSMAYGVPHVALDRVGKLTAYMSTWGGGLTPFDVPAAELASAASKALRTPREDLLARAEQLADQSWRNTLRVLEATRR